MAGGIRYCPNCEGIVEEQAPRCGLCGLDLVANPPLINPPSILREQALAASAQEQAEPSKVLGVMAWIAQLTAGAIVLFFCLIPALLVIVGFFVVLFIGF